MNGADADYDEGRGGSSKFGRFAVKRLYHKWENPFVFNPDERQKGWIRPERILYHDRQKAWTMKLFTNESRGHDTVRITLMYHNNEHHDNDPLHTKISLKFMTKKFVVKNSVTSFFTFHETSPNWEMDKICNVLELLNSNNLIITLNMELLLCDDRNLDHLDSTKFSYNMTIKVLDFFSKSKRDKKILINFASDFFRMADQCGLQEVKGLCEKILLEKLNDDNVLEIFLFAHEHSANRLKEHSIAFAGGHRKFMEGEQWENFKREHPTLYGELCEAIIKNNEMESPRKKSRTR